MISSGSKDAKIWIIGEAPGEKEIIQGEPFVGASGWELNKMLSESGFSRSECFLTNVCHERPPNNEIKAFFLNKTQAKEQGVEQFRGRYPLRPVREGVETLQRLLAGDNNPKLILALGDTALWGLSDYSGIGKWRGSQLNYNEGTALVPTFHPAAILRDWTLRPETITDLRRARDVFDGKRTHPTWNFLVRPRFEEVMGGFESLRQCVRDGVPIVSDIETRRGQIACVGFASDPFSAMCVPFMCVERPEGYWSESEEAAITESMRDVMTMPSAQFVFQHGLFDAQYFAKQMGFIPRISDDTLVLQHTLFPELRKALDYMASLYCEHYVYWKDDGKLWNESIGEDQQWTYNCTDCVRTYEVFLVLQQIKHQMGMDEQYAFQMKLFHAALKPMLRGMAIDLERKKQVSAELKAAKWRTQKWLETALEWPDFNPNSSPQMNRLFYEELACKVVRNPKTKQPTLNEGALQTIARRNPILRPLCTKIEEYRSLGVFKSTFADMRLSEDQRMRCEINMAGTNTFRFSTSEDAFGSGTNLQNLPKGTEE